MKFIIRKLECGHWIIVRVFSDVFDEAYIYFQPIAHVDTFSDILLLINGEASIEYV